MKPTVLRVIGGLIAGAVVTFTLMFTGSLLVGDDANRALFQATFVSLGLTAWWSVRLWRRLR